MLKRSWVQALCAAVCLLALAGCGGNECDTPADCRAEQGNPPAGKEYTCVENKCGLRDVTVPVKTCTPECAATEFCDTTGAAGVCRTCSATQGCSAPLVCDAAANSGKGVCKACTDSTASGTDLGCTAASPMCDTTGGNGQGVCKTCTDTASGGAADMGCSASTPLCDPAGNSGAGLCKACSDTATGTTQDLGCSVTSPVCDPAAANGIGACKTCTDTAQGTSQDLGCSAAAPICATQASGGRGACRACQDTAVANGTDLNCSAATPLCDVAAGNGAGVCKACVDSAAGNAQDQGCSAGSPVCDPLGGNGAGVCRNCVDTASGAGTDVGCGASAPICDPAGSGGAGTCRACQDSATGGSTDLGCAVGSPVCDAMASNGVGACKVCVDTAGPGSNTQDDGCFSPTAICDPAASSGAGACKVCVPTEGCPGAQTCNALGTACEGCVDNASCTNASTPFCKATPPPSVCVECLVNGQCTNPLRPACSASNFCGCADDDDCEAAPGNTDFCLLSGNNNRGECKVCLTDASCQKPGSTTPFCENQTACIQCRTTADCALTQVCNATTKACEAVPNTPDITTTNDQIIQFRNLGTGPLNPPFLIEGAFVTYVKPGVGDPQSGDSPGGFFLQALATGPAIFVSTDPGTVQVGDRITLSIGAKQQFTTGGVQGATTISGLITHSRGHPVQNLSSATPAGLAIDVTGASDLVTNVESYFGKIVRLTGTISGGTQAGGSGHTAFDVKTGVLTATPLPRLRVPTTFATQYELVDTCTFTLDVGVMWKFTSGGTTPTTTAQPSAYSREDFSALTCPAPKLIKARALSSTQVQLTFDRTLDDDTVQAADFTIATLTITAATVTANNAKEVTLTTSEQNVGQAYTVSVDGDVRDVGGRTVDPAAKTFNFTGFSPPPAGASLVLNELDIDNVNVDSAEYIEIYNRGGQAADLTNVVLLLVNGDAPAGTATTPRKEYLRFALSNAKDAGGQPATSLPAGGYLVAASTATLGALSLPAGTLRLTIAASGSAPGDNIVQNGADGIGLMDDTTGTLIDTVFYKGGDTDNGSGGPVFEIVTGAGTKQLNFQEGTIALARDPAATATPTATIGRSPNGVDSNINDSDFVIFTTGTPGAANQ